MIFVCDIKAAAAPFFRKTLLPLASHIVRLAHAHTSPLPFEPERRLRGAQDLAQLGRSSSVASHAPQQTI